MEESTHAPTASFPGVVDGDFRRVDLGSHVGEAIVVLVLYPSNAGPHAAKSATLLRACEGLTSRESDVLVVGVAPESPYSHRRFAHRADLSVPLLSDTAGHLAEEYGVDREGPAGVTVPTRSVFAFDYRGGTVYEWSAADPGDQLSIETLQSRLSDITPEKSARGCYRVAHAHYTEGRRRLSRGLAECGDSNWAIAQTEFEDACGEFAEATDMFMKGQGLATETDAAELNDRARERSTAHWEAAEWLAGFAMAAEKGDTERKQRHREEARSVLETVRGTDPLPDPASGRDREHERKRATV
jgi:peroxiredoxin